jgi:hypothetical protein
MTMTKELVQTLESKLNLEFGYFLRCDDTSAPDEIKPDMYFYMWEEDRLMSVLNLCEEFNLNYDFGFQEWDAEIQSLYETSYVSNNHMNSFTYSVFVKK